MPPRANWVRLLGNFDFDSWRALNPDFSVYESEMQFALSFFAPGSAFGVEGFLQQLRNCLEVAEDPLKYKYQNLAHHLRLGDVANMKRISAEILLAGSPTNLRAFGTSKLLAGVLNQN